MSNYPGPGTNSPESEAAAARELLALQQAMAHLVTTESRLEGEQAYLQSQIAASTWQTQYAQQANRDDLAWVAQQRRATLQNQLVGMREQLAHIAARKEEITHRQAELQTQLGALRAGQNLARELSWRQSAPPWKETTTPQKRSSWLLITLTGLVALALLTSLALGWVVLYRASHPPTLTQRQTPATRAPMPTPFPKPVPLRPFHPNGSAPASQQCLDLVGTPCYSPEQIQQAFNLTSLYQQGYAGAGQTIVILGAGNTTHSQNDLRHFDQAWGLPDPPSFQVIEPDGPPAPYSCPDGIDDLALESTLDVEWAHAIAPGASIILLIGSNDSGGSQQANCSFAGLLDTLSYAVNQHLGQIISISFGGSELGQVSDSAGDRSARRQAFQQIDNLLAEATSSGMTVVAASGDDGATNPNGGNKPKSVWSTPNVSWPASDPYVLAVGGTTLQLKNDSGTYQSERVWNDSTIGASGGGLSSIFPEPTYQQTMPDQALFHGHRSIPDVAFPAENFEVYASFEQGVMGQANPNQWNHWDILFGTSASAPAWAGLVAIANQMRGEPLGQIQPALYSLRGQGMHDITVGNNTLDGVQGYSAQSGYDLATGWGTPVADQLLPALIRAMDQSQMPCGTPPRSCG